ncbi:tetraprenyl-beta-curcumene synthase family protein [Paenibacillus thalictri]|uniref:Tetraprenyl-beta-curcumene synthase family protein n=1 Tax=Paenibacillus thalictri TaxID=2527873 RepID=A0A4Q9DWJ5_9BACL|nr:tetraprenyl-beta-curcumene synthase family protein [Paenibacillus thalictri]TBL81409.1 tetraprenyl-beta-curcumene synthase family protein [Paenibacillus thalictri]
MLRVYRYVLPEVHKQLHMWRNTAERIPDPELRKQAIDSMTSKKFHCEGGAVYAAANLPMRHVLIPLIVAFQTISDYLDNLCDRSTSLDAEDFRQLHQAMLDAVNPSAPIHDYYKFHQEKDDGLYLEQLVKMCQTCIRQLPSYSKAALRIAELVGLYCDLQVHKHIKHELREPELLGWWESHKHHFPHIRWNEFAAATGSTLGVFMLFLAAASPRLDERFVEQIYETYFPYICGLHILLDYLIDQEEDLAGGDLNFCSYYENRETTVNRIALIAEEARSKALQLEHSSFHRMIIEGLLALYLSDPKVKDQPEVRHISRQLMKGSPLTRLFFFVNSMWIRKIS